MAQPEKNPPAIWETWLQSVGWEDLLEKGKATHSSILAWRIPWTCIVHGVTKSRTRLSNFHFFFFFLASLVAQTIKRLPAMPGFDPWVGKIPWRRAWQPTPVFLPGESPWTEELGRLQSMGSQRVGHP